MLGYNYPREPLKGEFAKKVRELAAKMNVDKPIHFNSSANSKNRKKINIILDF